MNLKEWAQELLDASNDPDTSTDNFMTEARSFFEEFLTHEVAVWTLTVDPNSMDSITTSVYANEQEIYDDLRKNYAPELPEGVSADVLVQELEDQGVVWYMDQHVVEMQS